MHEKLKNIFLLVLLILLQACSGGKIGNFLESSFQNIDVKEIKNKENNFLKKNDKISNKQTMINKNLNQINKINKDSQNIKYPKKEDLKKEGKSSIKDFIEDDKIQVDRKKSTKVELNKKRKILKPQSYRITIILNEVDPSSPLEDFSNVLKNSNINFEIENIQRSPTKKIIKNKI